MDVIGMIFGFFGLAIAMAATRQVHSLEKKLKQLGVLPGDFSSSNETK